MTNDIAERIRALDEHDALIVLAHLVDDLRGRLDESTRDSVQNERDARQLVSVFADNMPEKSDALLQAGPRMTQWSP